MHEEMNFIQIILHVTVPNCEVVHADVWGVGCVESDFAWHIIWEEGLFAPILSSAVDYACAIPVQSHGC